MGEPAAVKGGTGGPPPQLSVLWAWGLNVSFSNNGIR